MVKTPRDLAINLVKIYRIKIHKMNKEITHYKVKDYSDKEFIFSKDDLHKLIDQSRTYHGITRISAQYSLLEIIRIRKVIDHLLIKNLEAFEQGK